MKEQILTQDLTKEYEALYLRFTTKIFVEKEENRVSRMYEEIEPEVAEQKGYKYDPNPAENGIASNFGMYYFEHSGLCANTLQSTNLKDALEEIKNNYEYCWMFDINSDDFAIVTADECRVQDAYCGDGVNLIAKSIDILYIRNY